jgi:cellulose synthase/poly-beta-1,6-N-acetylglucosamine synthase-like glycosyltransferase
MILRLANRHAGKLLLLGLVGVAVHNWRQWQRDKAQLARQKEPDPLPPFDTGADLPLVSVLVAAWNEAEGIAAHVESFLRLRYPRRELVLCAGGEDGTYDLAASYAADGAIVLRQEPGEGKQRALRRCLGRATGEIIFLTDADCLLDDDAFERTLAPIIHEGEAVATGTSRPLPGQYANPFVLHQWFTQAGGTVRQGAYVDGILGRNAALRRDALEAAGGFDAEVRTGTDYYMAKQLLRQGYRIRHVPDSAVETPFPETLAQYRRQHTRWLRNVVVHGLRFGDYDEVLRCMIPSLLGGLMLAGPVVALFLGPVALVGWLLLFLHALLSRVRYMRFGESLTHLPFPRAAYARLPLYVLADFAIWATTLLQYLSKGGRRQW